MTDQYPSRSAVESSISVVVPTFKRPGMLAETLASLTAQTHRNFIATICDNAADPETEAVVKELGDSRFVYLPRPENLGMHRNAIDGFRRAEGELVMKVDDDDILRPTCLETLAAPFSSRSDLTLSFSQIDLIDSASEKLPLQTKALSAVTGRDTLRAGYYQPFSHLAAGGAIQLCSALVRRDAVDWGILPEETATSYDLHIALEAARDNSAAYYTPEPLVGYRLHPGSDSANKLAAQLTGAVFALQYALDSGRHWDPVSIKEVLRETQLRRARELMIIGDTADAREALRKVNELRRSKSSARLTAMTFLPTSVQGKLMRGRKARVVDMTRLGAHSSTTKTTVRAAKQVARPINAPGVGSPAPAAADTTEPATVQR